MHFKSKWFTYILNTLVIDLCMVVQNFWIEKYYLDVEVNNFLYSWCISMDTASRRKNKAMGANGYTTPFTPCFEGNGGHSVVPTVLDGFFSILDSNDHSPELACPTHVWTWPTFFKVIQPCLCNKILTYNTSCGVHSRARTVLNVCFPYLAQLITSMRGCASHNHFWLWPIS